MSKQKTNRSATADSANHLTDEEAGKYRRLQSEFERLKHLLELLDLGYPEAVTAVDEYAGAYISSVQLGETEHDPVAWHEACEISNALACVSGSWRSYAERAMRSVMSEGDELGDVLPGDVVNGLRFIRHQMPGLFDRLVRMDKAVGPCLPLSGSDFAAPAVMMRAAIAAAAA